MRGSPVSGYDTGRYRRSLTTAKALRILGLFEHRERLTLSEVARELELPPAVAHRLLGSLSEEALIERDPVTKVYRLGLRMFVLASKVGVVNWVREKVKPAMSTLVDRMQETCLLTVRRDLQAVCIERVECASPIRVTMDIGKAGPLHAGASGRVLLAFAPEYFREQVLGSALERFTLNTCVEPSALRERLDLIRSRGYDTSEGELDAGVFAMGAYIPVYQGEGICIAFVMPSTRCTEAKTSEMISLLLDVVGSVGR